MTSFTLNFVGVKIVFYTLGRNSYLQSNLKKCILRAKGHILPNERKRAKNFCGIMYRKSFVLEQRKRKHDFRDI